MPSSIASSDHASKLARPTRAVKQLRRRARKTQLQVMSAKQLHSSSSRRYEQTRQLQAYDTHASLVAQKSHRLAHHNKTSITTTSRTKLLLSLLIYKSL